MELELATRRQVTKSMAARYAKGNRAEKGQVLDQLVAVTGWHRDHARRALRQAGQPARPRAAREPTLRYGPEVVDALAFCWAVLDGPTGKRLRPALPTLVPALLEHGELQVSDAVVDQLLSMSAATIDRRLAEHRHKVTLGRGRARTKPGSLLKASLPLKTWAEWSDTTPGFTEIDLVSHDGGDNNRHHCWSLCVTDVATGWTAARSVMGKGEQGVAAALGQIQLELPFHLAGIHSDNGSEFINYHLAKWVDARQITFTRSRPANKNDNAYVEQKNWSVIRRAVGYFRYETTHEQELLNNLWELECTLTNLFLPQQKLISKTRVGAKVTKKYDTAATPATRLLRDHPDHLDTHDRRAILEARAATNPAALRRQIASIQGQLIHIAQRRGPTTPTPRRQAVYESKRKVSRPPQAS